MVAYHSALCCLSQGRCHADTVDEQVWVASPCGPSLLKQSLCACGVLATRQTALSDGFITRLLITTVLAINCQLHP